MHFEIRSTDGHIVALARYLSAREGEFFNSDRYGSRAARQRARRTIQPPPGTPAERSSLSAAGSSVMAHIVQGFALCATSMHPEGYWQWSEHLHGYESLIEPPRHRDRDAPATIDRPDGGSWELPSFGRWIASLPRKLWSGILRAHARARARSEWERMDDRTLRDIGVSRHEAYRRTRHPRWI